FAGGVGASPKELHFETHSTDSTRLLTVVNTGSNVSDYSVFVEGEYEEWFEITPSTFTLKPGENKEVAITLSPPLLASGDHDATICVVSFEPSSGLNIGTGIKVPARMTLTLVSHIFYTFIAITLALLVLMIVLGAVFIPRRRRA
ncbi:MAG: hypothetical protein SVO26_05630, partial [Chloroflexota bacterium]|nr:hypothetical protein [Chloroflexota bacterium]